MLHVRQAKPEDADSLASRLRDADLQELRAVGEFDPLTALLRSIRVSDFPLTVVDATDFPVAIFGTAPTTEPLVGAIWLLGSDDLVKHRLSFIRECRQWIDVMQTYYSILANIVDERNTVHIRWLRWCGFVFLKRHHIVSPSGLGNQAGPGHHTFLEFVRIKSCVNQPLSQSPAS